MKLQMGTFTVTHVEKGHKTALDKGVLTINIEELTALIREDRSITGVDVEFAYPGESTRIVHVLDAIEPRVKVSGPSCCFPGFIGTPKTVGQGMTHRLSGVAVIGTTTKIHIPSGVESGVLEFNEGIIDMSGPGQKRSMCSETVNICLCMTTTDTISTVEYDRTTRMAMLKTADYLARATLGKTPDDMREYAIGVANPDVPNVAYINQVQSQGFLCRTFLYAMPMEPYYTPTLLSPMELMDGAVVNSNFRNNMRCCTFMQQNNYVVDELFNRHGKELNFVGMIMSRGHYDDQPLKIRLGQYSAKLAAMIGAQAAILTIEGTGNSNIDYMHTVSALEDMDIVAVPIIHEFGGPHGEEEALFEFPKQAVSLVSGGGIDREVKIPAMNRVIGGDSVLFTDGPVANKEIDPHAALVASAHYFFCGFRSLQQNGFSAEDC